jgi:hypothetical protein
MVEFVIILPVMLTLVLAIVQFALIYKAKITLNYATFQAVRAGSLNNASLSEMEQAFTSNMAPMFTSSYLRFDSTDGCTTDFNATDGARLARLGGAQITEDGLRGVLDSRIGNFDSEKVLCARRIVQQQLDDGYVNITVVNPTITSFNILGVDGYHDVTGNDDIRLVNMIPNDNLMYRNPQIVGVGISTQSIQDANLLKIHVGYCYELIIPFVNRMIWAMQRYGPGAAPAAEARFANYWADPAAAPPGFFGPPSAGFASSCITNPADTGRRSIVLYSQSIMRMQSAAVQCETTDTCAPASP